MLLGMLMTVLTMVFNQSSISWRIGAASVKGLDDATDGISSVRDVADNVYCWDGSAYLLTSLWDGQKLRDTRPLATTSSGGGGGGGRSLATLGGTRIFQSKLREVVSGVEGRKGQVSGHWSLISIADQKKQKDADTYTVNVMSAGPNRQFNDYDDIWSFPNEFN